MHSNSVLSSGVRRATDVVRGGVRKVATAVDDGIRRVSDAVQTMQNKSVRTDGGRNETDETNDRRAIVKWAAVGYALGSICWGHVFARLQGQSLSPDEHPGTRATGERFGLKWGGATLLLDVSMVAISVFLARTLQSSSQATGAAGLAAAAGHLWPLYFGFHGGHLAAPLVGSLVGWGHAGEAIALLSFCLSTMVVGKSLQERGYLNELDVTAFAFTSAFAGLFIWFHSYQQVEVVYYFVGLGLVAGLRFGQNALEAQQGTPDGGI